MNLQRGSGVLQNIYQESWDGRIGEYKRGKDKVSTCAMSSVTSSK